MYRRAPFIWVPEQKVAEDVRFVTVLRGGASRRDDGRNRWYLFRRRFELPVLPERASCDVTVDGRYQLFVNAELVGRGPCRSSPNFQRYDTHDLRPHLRAGQNAVAVLIHVYGIDTAWYEVARGPWQTLFGDGGLFFHLSGIYPTVRGDIRVDWTRSGESLSLRVTVPEASKAEIEAPPGFQPPAGAATLGPGKHELRFSP